MCNTVDPISNDNKIWPQCVTTAITALVLFSGGIQVGWSSPSIPILLSDKYALNVTSSDAAYIATVANIGQICGAVLYSLLMDVIGRKNALLTAAPLHISSMLFIYFASSTSISLLYIGRFIAGMAGGGSELLLPIYISEISEPRIRGVLVGSFIIALVGGTIFINLVGTYYSIETTSLITLAFPIISFVLFLFMVETPYYYLMKNKVVEATNSLKKLRWNDNVDGEMSQMQKDVDRQMTERCRIQDLIFEPSNRKAIIVICVLEILQVFSGVPALTLYAQTFFAEATDDIPKEWAAVIVQFVKLIFVFVGAALMDTIGRRLSVVISTTGCSVIMTLMSVYFFLKDYTSIAVEDYSWLPLIGVMLQVAFYVSGVAVASKCLLGELFSVNVKAKAMCILSVFYYGSIFASTNLFQYLSTNYTTAAPFLMFAIIQFLGIVISWFFIPETKKKSLGQIQQDLKESEKS